MPVLQGIQMLAIAMTLSVAAQGPISKFSDRAPTLSIETATKLEDVERCLIDMKGWLAPYVYRQPDRPDAVTLIWTGPNGLTAGRVDLRRRAIGTTVVAWMPAKQISGCAPAG